MKSVIAEKGGWRLDHSKLPPPNLSLKSSLNCTYMPCTSFATKLQDHYWSGKWVSSHPTDTG